MTAADMQRLLKVLQPAKSRKPTRLIGPLAAHNHPAFKRKLDTKRLDIGLASAMGKHRGMGG